MFGKQARDMGMDFGSFLHQSANAVKDEYKSMYSGFKQDMANKSLAKRQNIIKQNEVNSQLEHEAWLADRAEGAPKNWGEALKSAGGGKGAAWRVGSGAVAGGAVGGGLDYSQGNDGISDGIAIGAASGALIGAGSFARSVHKLKVGKYTPTVDGGVSVNYAGPQSVHNNKGTYDASKSPIPYKQPSATDKILKNNDWTLQDNPSTYKGPSVDFELSGHERNTLAVKRAHSKGFGW